MERFCKYIGSARRFDVHAWSWWIFTGSTFSSEAWRDSIIHPITHPVTPAFNELKLLMEQEVNELSVSLWQEDVNRSVEGIAGLTAVDGATVINDKLS